MSGPGRRLFYKSRLIVPAPAGGLALLKIYDSALAARKKPDRLSARRERSSLRMLAGLAVPGFVGLSRMVVRRLVGFSPTSYVAQTFVPGGKHLDKAGLGAAQLLGTWFFIAEQLVAFRRRRVLYTDIKGSNILVRRNPLRVTQIDFNFCAAVKNRGRYFGRWFGYTRGLQPPEQVEYTVTEAVLSYQFAMLLVSCRLGIDNSLLRDPKRGLTRLTRELRGLGAPKLATLLAECLDPDPRRRPRNYEELLRRINAATRSGRPAGALRVWDKLRRPYAGPLAELGLVR